MCSAQALSLRFRSALTFSLAPVSSLSSNPSKSSPFQKVFAGHAPSAGSDPTSVQGYTPTLEALLLGPRSPSLGLR